MLSPQALELVTSPWFGIDVLTRKARLKKRLGGRMRESRERENEVFLLSTSIFSHIKHEIKVARDVSG